MFSHLHILDNRAYFLICGDLVCIPFAKKENVSRGYVVDLEAEVLEVSSGVKKKKPGY